MSRFTEDFTSRSAPRLFDLLGDSSNVSYTRYSDLMRGTVASGFPVSISVIFDLLRKDRVEGDDGEGETQVALFKIYANDTNGVSDPQIETDTITRDGTEWTVREIQSVSGGVASLVCSTYVQKKTGSGAFELERFG